MHEISNNVVCATSKASDQPAHSRSLIRAFASRLSILLTEHHFEFLSLKGGCRGSSDSTHVKMPHRWKSQVLAQLLFLLQVVELAHLDSLKTPVEKLYCLKATFVSD